MKEYKNSNLFKKIMGWLVAQDPALMDRVTAVAALTLDSKEIKAITATRVVTISSVIRGVNSSNSLVIRATRSS